MKKIAVLVLTVGLAVVAAQAQGLLGIKEENAWARNYMKKSHNREAQNKANLAKELEVKVAEMAKFDFAGLPQSVQEGMRNIIKQKYTTFDHAAYIGQIDSYNEYSWAHSNDTQSSSETYYFVVTVGDTDDFYVGIRKMRGGHLGIIQDKTTDTLADTIYMGTAFHDKTLDYKKALENFMKSLPQPFNKHAKDLLKRVPFTTIDSIKVIDEASFQNIVHGETVTTTEYKVQYNLKDGSSFLQTFIYTPQVTQNGGTFGSTYGEKVEKI